MLLGCFRGFSQFRQELLQLHLPEQSVPIGRVLVHGQLAGLGPGPDGALGDAEDPCPVSEDLQDPWSHEAQPADGVPPAGH